MELIDEGTGDLVGWNHPDDFREWNKTQRSRSPDDKRMTAAEAVDKYVDPGDVIVNGGFGQIRISTPIIHEIIRQDVDDLTMYAKTGEFDTDLLMAANVVSRAEIAYVGLETRGLSAVARRRVEGGEMDVVAEGSNAALQWRLLAGKMGVPFMPTRVMNGTDTFKHSSAKVVEDPWTGDPVTLVPSINPDTAFIHVTKADKYGNAVIEGIIVEDHQISGAAKNVIVTAEEIVPSSEICQDPSSTDIPFFNVDAVVEAPYGSHPVEMSYQYYFDEEHLAEYIDAAENEETLQEYIDEYIRDTENFEEYLEKIGGEEKLAELEAIETYDQDPEYPWCSD
jgi:3-oxoacid CoA-transferase subunit A/glutaconate CoA-transferase subunit A